jgi:hypothetical protein
MFSASFFSCLLFSGKVMMNIFVTHFYCRVSQGCASIEIDSAVKSQKWQLQKRFLCWLSATRMLQGHWHMLFI